MKSTLEKFKEGLFERKSQIDEELKEDEKNKMESIVELILSDKELNNQINVEATKTIKTIQPSILFDDFVIAMAMIKSTVSHAMYYLAEKGHLKIKEVK